MIYRAHLFLAFCVEMGRGPPVGALETSRPGPCVFVRSSLEDSREIGGDRFEALSASYRISSRAIRQRRWPHKVAFCRHQPLRRPPEPKGPRVRLIGSRLSYLSFQICARRFIADKDR